MKFLKTSGNKGSQQVNAFTTGTQLILAELDSEEIENFGLENEKYVVFSQGITEDGNSFESDDEFFETFEVALEEFNSLLES